MLDQRSSTDRRGMATTRPSAMATRRRDMDRRLGIMAISEDRRSGIERRSGMDRRVHLDRRMSAVSFRDIF
ncbi:MAG: hypothetical protein ACETWG_01720 [Candidatus Neomarinimicrobiota bacterium]